DAALPDGRGEAWLDVALALGAPLLIVRAPQAADEPAAWGRFTDALRSLAGSAKRTNVTLALRNGSATLCAAAGDLKRVAKDVDSAWLRFALDQSELGVTADTSELLPKTAIAVHSIDDLATFASAAGSASHALIERLMRFRGFVSLDSPANRTSPTAFHEAIERFAAERALALFPAIAK
ncbi:MAG: TIM barrel protein, partial [Candidatus Eremiobacteraeota bacterium]|nr:TIM barrel protein [Candidatus Eremiobacteraeota bacterium]